MSWRGDGRGGGGICIDFFCVMRLHVCREARIADQLIAPTQFTMECGRGGVYVEIITLGNVFLKYTHSYRIDTLSLSEHIEPTENILSKQS